MSRLACDVPTPVIVLLADGLRADTLRQALDAGHLPAMAALRAAGALCDVTSVFPSVTGPAYVPILTGRFPGGAGIPGLRWFDRARTATSAPDHARSYVGWQMNAVNRDLDDDARTIFERAPFSAGALSMITRGLTPDGQLAVLNLRSALRAIRTHFGGNLREWLVVDRETSSKVVARARRGDTPYLFAAFMGTDKLSHAQGQQGQDIIGTTTSISSSRAADTGLFRIRGCTSPTPPSRSW
jgi:predicted AlkP superfamily pyrophosphatase or phosphodiesterase